MDVFATSSIDADHLDDQLDANQLAADLSQAVTRLRRALQRAARANFDGESLSPTEVELLLLVAERPGIGVAVAASELGAAPNTVSTLIRKLVALGLLRREFSRGDRRVARLLLTEEAEARIERWRGQRADVLTDSFGQLDNGQLATLQQALPVMEALSAALYQPRRRTKAPSRQPVADSVPEHTSMAEPTSMAEHASMAESAGTDAESERGSQREPETSIAPSNGPIDLRPAWRPDVGRAENG